MTRRPHQIGHQGPEGIGPATAEGNLVVYLACWVVILLGLGAFAWIVLDAIVRGV